MLVGGIVVEDGVDQLAGRNVSLNGVEEADELLMGMFLHAAAEDGAVQDIEGGEERGCAVALKGRIRTLPLAYVSAGLNRAVAFMLALAANNKSVVLGFVDIHFRARV